MIKHIVFFRLNDYPDPAEKQKAAADLADIFQPLDKLPSVSEFKASVNISNSKNAWDMVIDSTFNSEEDLEEYRISKEHREAIEKGKPYYKETAVADYKL